jgi:hypothetical protein
VELRSQTSAVAYRLLPAGIRSKLAQVPALDCDPSRKAITKRAQANLQDGEAKDSADGGGDGAE